MTIRKEVIGNCELYCGDCMEVMPMLGKVDAVVTDPPYGTTACKWDIIIPFDKMWEQLDKLINPNRAIILFGSEPFSSLLRTSNLNIYKYDWIWEKSRPMGFLEAKNKPMKKHEIISVFSHGKSSNGCKSKMLYNPQGLIEINKKMKNSSHGDVVGYRKSREIGKVYNQKFTNYPNSILKFASVPKPCHPTQKPVALMEYLIKTYTLENETVLDFTMGSGTTGVACINTNRKFIGIELDQTYFDIACKRIEQAISKYEQAIGGNQDDKNI